ncbi:MAG: hypothetical protein J1F20_08540 [Muribaculaceae bacterium]|nr:hypothetical protein [Muribaculaceae bacterium]
MVKKFTLLAVVSLMTGGTLTASPIAKVSETNPETKPALVEKTLTVNGKSIKIQPQRSKKAPAKVQANFHTPVIESAPGNYKYYSRFTTGVDDAEPYEAESYTCVAYDDNGDVYIKDMLACYNYGSFVKGSIDGNVITVELPQTIRYFDDYDYGFNLGVLKLETYEEDGMTYGTYVLDETVTSITYTIDETDGSMTMNLPTAVDNPYAPTYILGLIYTDIDPYYDKEWEGAGDYTQEYTWLNEGTSLPEGLTVEPYTQINADYAYSVGVAFDDNAIYFKGLCDLMPETVTIGTVEEGAIGGDEPYKVSIAQNQLVGLWYGMLVYTKVARYNPMNGGYTLGAATESYELMYDPATNKFTAVDPNVYLVYNCNLTYVYGVQINKNVTIVPAADNMAGTPINPDNLSYKPYAPLYGYNQFIFVPRAVSTEGALLDTDCLYYSIYVNGEKILFAEEEGLDLTDDEVIFYEDLPEPTYEVPYSFNNDWDIEKFLDQWYVGLYIADIETVGVQTVYIYDGVTTKSDIVTLNIETGEITTTPADDTPTGVTNVTAPAVASEYYTITGMKVSNPTDGIFIRRTTHADGSVSTNKIIIK